AEGERPDVERQRGHYRRDQVDDQRDKEHALAPEAVGEPAEEERAGDRAADVGRGRPADLSGAEAERVRALERRPERADYRDLEAVEQPAHAERDHHAPVPGGPRQPIE